MSRGVFPFVGAVGQEKLKKALILGYVNPQIGGLLIVGSKGCGKSTLVRASAEITDQRIVELPLNTTMDRVGRSLDVSRTVRDGRRRYEEGILERARGQILYIDEVNLLPDSLTGVLTATHGTEEYPYFLVGTMNPEEGMVRPQFLDHFGMYVQVKEEKDLAERCQILKSVMEFERDPDAYRRRYREETEKLRREICLVRQRLSQVQVSEEIYSFSANLCRQGGCQGLRGDIYLIETAKACAAWAGELEVDVSHIREAVSYVLPHRLSREPDEQGQEGRGAREETDLSSQQSGENNPHGFAGSMEQGQTDKEEVGDTLPEEIFSCVPGIERAELPTLPKDRRARRGSGKRSRTRTSRQGRYIRYTYPGGRCKDLALDATLRAAAPYQRFRSREGVAICVERRDFREKVREQRVGASILFVVDGSRSMEARRRMAFAKGAVLSILEEAYCKRDQTGMVVFQDGEARVSLDFTRSVELAQKRLEELPVRGNTPLAQGLRVAYRYLRKEWMRNPDMLPVVVLLTDGKANDAVSEDPFQEAVRAAKMIKEAQIPAVVIDTETGFVRMRFAREIADAMGASCVSLERLMPEEIGKMVHRIL